jgi:hypothetical protein
MTAVVHLYDGRVVRALSAPAERPLRWAAWRPQGDFALLVGNRGEALRFEGAAFTRLRTDSAHNLRGAGWSPDGTRALLVGNRGAVLLHDGETFRELPSPTTENLRRAEWSRDGSCALIIGNSGVVLRYDARTERLDALPGDRAHTLRSIAWRPDGAFALIGGYASRHAGYPRPHALYRCDGRYTQGILATEDEDDTVAISWQPDAGRPRALLLMVAYGERRDAPVANKIVDYDGSTFRSTTVDAAALLGLAWRPDAAEAIACGEGGALYRYGGGALEAIDAGTRDNLVGPFWRPGGATLALLLKGPDEKVYTV